MGKAFQLHTVTSRNHGLSDSRRWADRYTNYLLTMDVTTRLSRPPTVNGTGKITYEGQVQRWQVVVPGERESML